MNHAKKLKQRKLKARGKRIRAAKMHRRAKPKINSFEPIWPSYKQILRHAMGDVPGGMRGI